MRMPMMDIWKMRVFVRQRRVLVPMGMHLISRPRKIMQMLVMRVMPMPVAVRQRFMDMRVLVTLGQM